MTELVTQAEFARLLGINSRSYITKLKADGRLVMNGDQVDVEASRLRIIETADPNRDDVVIRWARERGQTSALIGDSPEETSYASARARKEKAQADMAEMERDKRRGQLLDRAAVEAAFEDILTTMRQALEQHASRVAPQLVGLDLDKIRALLKQETHASLKELVGNFNKAIKAIVEEEAGA